MLTNRKLVHAGATTCTKARTCKNIHEKLTNLLQQLQEIIVVEFMNIQNTPQKHIQILDHAGTSFTVSDLFPEFLMRQYEPNQPFLMAEAEKEEYKGVFLTLHNTPTIATLGPSMEHRRPLWEQVCSFKKQIWPPVGHE